jgi:hypothetical protein
MELVIYITYTAYQQLILLWFVLIALHILKLSLHQIVSGIKTGFPYERLHPDKMIYFALLHFRTKNSLHA